MSDVLNRLAATIAARRGADPAGSHTAALLAKGPAKCAEKFGEEAVEAIVEAARGNGPRLTREAADVLYHLLVMLEASGVPFAAVEEELAARAGYSGVEEKASRSLPVTVRRAETPEELALCLALRAQVFIAEQGVPLGEEQDGEDPRCIHWLARRGTEPIGALRVKPVGPDGGPGHKIQRVAIERRARGTGEGARLMRAVLDDLAGRPGPVWLESQIAAIPFYERLGFVAEGPEFVDAGIVHRRMVLPR